MLGTPETSEPDDFTILGVRDGVAESALRAAWARFLGKVPADRFPKAFRQGRDAYERLAATRTRTRRVRQFELSGACLACEKLRGLAFRTCLVCARDLSRENDDPIRREAFEVSNPKVSKAVREAEARWGAARHDELRAAAERGLGEADLEPRARARLALLLGHANAAEGNVIQAREQWVTATSDIAEADEARLCLAFLAYGRTEFEETIHFVSIDLAEREAAAAVLRAAASLSSGRLVDAGESVEMALGGSPTPADQHRATWIAAQASYESGDPLLASKHLVELLGGLTGHASESLGAITDDQVGRLSPDLVWLCAVTLASTGDVANAERWLSKGEASFNWDPAFPRERGALALLRRDLNSARMHFAEAEKRGDRTGAARGAAIVEWEAAGKRDPESLVALAEKLNDAQLFYHAGLRFDATGNPRRAVEAYLRAVQVDPLSTRSIAAAGISLHRVGEKERAGQLLLRAWEAGERSSILLESLASVHLERGRIEEAVSIMRALVDRGDAKDAVRQNLARATRLLALQAANEAREEDAAELLGEAMAVDAESAPRWTSTEAEILFRAAWRAVRERKDGWEEAFEELSGRAASAGLDDSRIRLLEGLAALARTPDQTVRTKQLDVAGGAFGQSAGDEALLGLQLVLTAKESHLEADAIAQRLSKGNDPRQRLRSRWVQSISLAKRGNPVAGRVLLEESAKECARDADLAEFLKGVRLQILKLRAEELGPKRIEREIADGGGKAGPPEMNILWGIILAGQERYDEAARALQAAARDPSFRSEAEATRQMMQLSRVAALLDERKMSDALRLFVRLRPTLPDELEIDLWLNALEVEGVPAAALRDGDGKPAVATWSTRIQRWRKAKDDEYWELVRSAAVAALFTAVRAESRCDYAEAEQYWKTAVNRWLELQESDDYWASFERRGRDLFPKLDTSTVEEVREELLQVRLIGLLREVIAGLRDRGDGLVAAQRFEVLAQIEQWRLERDPGNAEIRGALASCHAQRLIIYSQQYMFDEARRFGIMACEVEPDSPVHVNNMAEMWGAEAGVALTKLQAQYESTGPGPHLRPLMIEVVDLLSLALAWNPMHPAYHGFYEQFAPQANYSGVAPGDSRFRKAVECRERLPAGVLEDYTRSVLEPQHPEAQGGQVPADYRQQGQPAPQQQSAGPGREQVLVFAKKLKDAGLSAESIYSALMGVFPQLGGVSKDEVMRVIQGA